MTVERKGVWTDQELQALRDGYANGMQPSALAEEIGRSPAAVRNKAYELKITADRAWTEAELDLLKSHITHDSLAGGIDFVANALGRTRASVALKVSRLGLGNRSRKFVKEWKDKRMFKGDKNALSVHISQRVKRQWAENGHPKGMAGKKHSAETRERLAKTSAEAWAVKTSEERQEWMDNLAKGQKGAPPVRRGTWLAGWREIGGKRNYYRSRWEANYARYLEWLRLQGRIRDWQHEPETFWFEAIKRGVRSYKPDFRVWEIDGSTFLHEVKGWMDARSKTTLKRMAKYYPNESIVIVRERQYNEIARKIGPMIEGWESGGRADRP
jgi:hypothetical protein